MSALDVASLERAVVAAVAPPEVIELRGWIAAFDDTTVSRARSAAPLSHAGIDADAVPLLCAAYRERGLSPVFRVPEACPPALAQALADAGLAPEQPTDVQVARTRDVAAAGDPAGVEVTGQVDDAWRAIFLGAGFDPVDGASRVKTLTRAPGSKFAAMREGGTVVAAGVLGLASGWASIHGMRTAQSHRGRRLATRVLAALADTALQHGHASMMLQVERDNAVAQHLYARCGFTRAWTYMYWRSR